MKDDEKAFWDAAFCSAFTAVAYHAVDAADAAARLADAALEARREMQKRELNRARESLRAAGAKLCIRCDGWGLEEPES